MRVGVIINPNAKTTLKGYSLKVREILGEYGELVFETERLEETRERLRLLKEEEVDIIAFMGGDGTLKIGVSLIMEEWGENAPKPFILAVKGGAFNLTARNIPTRGGAEATFVRLRKLLETTSSTKDIPRDNIRRVKTLKVMNSAIGKYEYGFTVTFGIPFWMTERLYEEKARTPRAALTMVSSAISKFIMGVNREGSLLRSFSAKITIDGEEYPHTEHLVVVSSVFTKLVLFFRPFYLKDDKWKDGFYLFVFSDDVWTALRNFRIVSRGLKRFKKSFNDIADEYTITTSEGYSFDGEVFKPQGELTLNVKLGPLVNLLRL